MSPLASLACFCWAVIGLYYAIRYINKRKKPIEPGVPHPTREPVVVDGVTIGIRTYGIPQDGIFVNVLKVETGLVHYTYYTDQDATVVVVPKEEFLAEFIRITSIYPAPSLPR